jgi:hypothetical protein
MPPDVHNAAAPAEQAYALSTTPHAAHSVRHAEWTNTQLLLLLGFRSIPQLLQESTMPLHVVLPNVCTGMSLQLC